MKPTTLVALVMLLSLLLTACGSAAPPSPTRSEREQQQTSVALSGRPTLAPLPSAPAPTSIPDLATIFAITDGDPRALGDPNAPILIIEFTDFE